MLALLIGFTGSFVGSLPIAGPIAALIVARGLCHRHRDGMAVAGGAALGESIHAFIAYWGTGALFGAHPSLAIAGRIAAAAIPIALGISFITAPGRQRADAPARIRGNFLMGLAISGFNPTLMATWTAVAAVVHSIEGVPGGPVEALLFATGVAAGGVAWAWLMLQFLSRYRERLSSGALSRVLRGVGVVMILVGLWSAFAFATR